MPPRTRKRTATTSKEPEPPAKRARKARVREPEDVIDVGDSSDNDDNDLKDALAMIKAQEDSERLAKQLQGEYDQPVASGSHSEPIDIDDDAAMARRLAEQWAREEEDMPMMVDDASSDIEILPTPIVGSSKSISVLDADAESSRTADFRLTADSSQSGKIYAARSIRPDEGLASFKDVFTRTRDCTKCNKRVKSARGCVVFSESALPPSLTYLLHSPCLSCRINQCRGCFQVLECPISCKGPSKNPKCSVLNCCAEIRAIAIFEILGGLDRQFIVEQAASASRASAMAKKSVKGRSVGPGGTGYGTGAENSVGNTYGSWRDGPGKKKGKQSAVSGKGQTQDTESHWERTIIRVMDVLMQLLPAPYSDSAQVFDMLPHASIGYLISLSQLPTVLAGLLRNDSVTDWISRKETYNTMLSLLRRMADCELTIQCLIGSRWETATTCGLEDWMWGDGEITWTKNASGELEIAVPLYSYFKKLTKQSEAFQSGAMQMLSDGQGDEEDVEETMIEGTSLCGDIIAARDDLERAIAFLGQPSATTDRDNRPSGAGAASSRQTRTSNKGKGRAISAIEIDNKYLEACEKLAFKHVSLADNTNSGLVYSRFNYAQNLTQTQTSTRNPKNRLHLLKELAVTATSLPAGVWVRVDEVRNDAIKIMIAGPDDTPYAGGLFEFDCFIPLGYPNTPPLMHLRTTGGGSVRFNPNLYNCGKVCLSLLGTWPGRPEEQWSPKSTLLQVLVSIQSMILIDAPYYNEPGHGQANLKASVSIQYNNDISAKTTRWAIVDWLRNEHRDGIWRDVIASHFSIRKDRIRQQIVDWSKTAPHIRAYTATGYPYQPYTPQNQPVAKKSQGGLDLLEEFDKGIKVIESWGVDLGVGGAH